MLASPARESALYFKIYDFLCVFARCGFLAGCAKAPHSPKLGRAQHAFQRLAYLGSPRIPKNSPKIGMTDQLPEFSHRLQEKCTALKRARYTAKARYSVLAVAHNVVDWTL